MLNFNISFNFNSETKEVSDIVVIEIDKISKEDDFDLGVSQDDAQQFNFDFNL